MGYQITVYTPTYNRAHLLPRVYQCLCRQTCKNFIWMVIDDGSTDETKKLIQEWKRQNYIYIEYYYKENGGVHTAREMAYHLCKTHLIASCDSDDMMTESAVEKWLSTWKQFGSNEFSGIISVAVDENGNRITDPFPPVKALSYQDYTYKYKCRKEKDAVFNIKILSMLEDYPVFSGENLVGEGFKWIQLPQNKPFLLLNENTRIYEQQADGYMRNVAIGRFNNPNGFRASYRQMIKYGKFRSAIVKGCIGYIAFSIILKDIHFIKDSPKSFLTVLLLPVGLLYYLKILIQKIRSKKFD